MGVALTGPVRFNRDMRNYSEDKPSPDEYMDLMELDGSRWVGNGSEPPF